MIYLDQDCVYDEHGVYNREWDAYHRGFIRANYPVPALRSAHRHSIERMKYQREIGFTFQAVFIAPRNLKMK